MMKITSNIWSHSLTFYLHQLSDLNTPCLVSIVPKRDVRILQFFSSVYKKVCIKVATSFLSHDLHELTSPSPKSQVSVLNLQFISHHISSSEHHNRKLHRQVTYFGTIVHKKSIESFECYELYFLVSLTTIEQVLY